jgi:zinc transporter, ZIP family
VLESLGLLASSSFLVGVVLGLAATPPRRLLAVVIAFGAGVLDSAPTFDLMGEAFERETGAYAITGFLVGAVIYVVADAALERLAARSPKRTGRDPQDVVPGAAAKPETAAVAATTGLALLVGALIDGIPESAASGRLHPGHHRRLCPARRAVARLGQRHPGLGRRGDLGLVGRHDVP